MIYLFSLVLNNEIIREKKRKKYLKVPFIFQLVKLVYRGVGGGGNDLKFLLNFLFASRMDKFKHHNYLDQSNCLNVQKRQS